MKLFIDTANINEIRQVKSWGILSGVTMNPVLVSKEGRPFKELAIEICKMFPSDAFISLEVAAMDAEGMVKQARKLANWSPNVVVKIPAIDEGLKALSVLTQEKIKTNFTIVFSASQAVLAALAGATFVSPFLGRLKAEGGNSFELLSDIVSVFKTHNVSTQVLAASIKTQNDVIEAFKAGSDVVTAPFRVLQEMIQHPLTGTDLKTFMDAWGKVPDANEVFK